MDSLQAGELIRRHQSGIWRYLRVLGCDTALADDLTQETFLRVLRREHFVDHCDQATAEYLRRTAFNLMISHHRKHNRIQTSDSPTLLDEAWQRWAGKDLVGDETIDALRECLALLTERARQAIRLRFVDQEARVKIGETLGISDHGARNLMQRAKAQLRQCLQERMKIIGSPK